MVDTIEPQADTVPPVSPKKQEVYLWSSWHPFNAYIGSFDHDMAMLELLETVSWKELSKKCSSKTAFSDKTLLAMRKIMDLPVHYPEYWKDAPWIDPTQEWVAEQIRAFVAWYVATIGEPK